MDFLIHFFRDILDGPLYWILVGVCFFLILFILGFLVDRHEKKERLRGMIESAPAGKERAVVSDETTPTNNIITNTNVITQNEVSVGGETIESEENKAAPILELSSEGYQDDSVVVQDNNNN